MFLALGPSTLWAEEPLSADRVRIRNHPRLVRVVIVEAELPGGHDAAVLRIQRLTLETSSCPRFDMNGCVTESVSHDPEQQRTSWRFSGYASDPLVSVLQEFARAPGDFKAALRGGPEDHAVLRDWCLQQGQAQLADWLGQGPDAPGGWAPLSPREERRERARRDQDR